MTANETPCGYNVKAEGADGGNWGDAGGKLQIA